MVSDCFQMRLGLTTYAVISLIGFYVITRHTTIAGFEETVEMGKEHRREELEANGGAANSGGAIGWRRKRNVMGELENLTTPNVNTMSKR